MFYTKEGGGGQLIIVKECQTFQDFSECPHRMQKIES